MKRKFKVDDNILLNALKANTSMFKDIVKNKAYRLQQYPLTLV